MNKDPCPRGQILRKGYLRKGFDRKGFYRKSGSYVKPSYISQAKVPATCVPDRGRPGKSPRTLPPVDDKIHLSRYGYSTKLPKSERRRALQAAAADSDLLLVYRRLNLIRNYQANDPVGRRIKNIMSEDIEYLKTLYQKQKRAYGRSRRSYEERMYERGESKYPEERFREAFRRSGDQRGGGNYSDTSDVVVETIGLPEKEGAQATIFYTEKYCDAENKECTFRNKTYEEHLVRDGQKERKVVFYTLAREDLDDVLKISGECSGFVGTREELNEAIANYSLIGIKVDNVFHGYVQYHLIDDDQIEIIRFCAHHSYRTPLYTFMEKFFRAIGCQRISIGFLGDEDLEKFWMQRGFKRDKNVLIKNLE